MHLTFDKLVKTSQGQTYVVHFGIKLKKAWPPSIRRINAYLAELTIVTLSVMSRTFLTSSAFIGERKNKFISLKLLQLQYHSRTVCDIALDFPCL